MVARIVLFFVVLFAFVPWPFVSAEVHIGTFLQREIRFRDVLYPYAVYTPPDYDPSRKWPVILFLHGAGERGNDGRLQTQVGLGAAIRKYPQRFNKTIAVFPQVPKESCWLDDPAMAAMQALDKTIAEFRGDANRVYLTGISMGGYGTWYLAIRFPKRFAAIIPICGGILPSPNTNAVRQLPITIGSSHPYSAAANAMPRIPIWIFHGSADQVVPVSESRRMFETLKQLNGNVRYTEYPGVDHASWDRAYDEKDLWIWLFSQHR